MSKSACVFIIVFLYGKCSGNFLHRYDTIIPANYQERRVNNGPIPSYYDWRDRGMVSRVKNQENCTACWAFSAVASIESHIRIHKHEYYALSEQFLIDCEKANDGCNSASIVKTFAHIVSDLGGVLLIEDYANYTADQRDCKWPGQPMPLPVIGFRRVRQSENAIAQAVYYNGPVSVGINSASMDRYTSGIDQPTDEQCPPGDLNHAVLIVGFNVYVSKDGKEVIPYWIIKNSWGEEWGDRGFYYLERGRNACGIANDASFPYVQ